MAYDHNPLGPDGSWKTGQRVPVSGWYRDQYNVVSHHREGRTFAPCIDRKGVCAYRHLIALGDDLVDQAVAAA